MVRAETVDQFRRRDDASVAAVNHTLSGVQEERIRYHVCRGNCNGPHSNYVACGISSA